MQASIRVSTSLVCAWGVTGFGWSAELPATTKKPSAIAGRASVDDMKPVGGRKPLHSARNIIRGQDPFGSPTARLVPLRRPEQAQPEQTQPAPAETLATDKPATVNPFEIPEARVTVTTGVIPPAEPVQPTAQRSAPSQSVVAKPTTSRTAAPNSPAPEGESEALLRLKERSAKARWEQLHQEWLKSRKGAEPTATAPRSQPAAPASASPAVPTTTLKPVEANPFEVLSPSNQNTAQPTPPATVPAEVPSSSGLAVPQAVPPAVPNEGRPTGDGVRRSSVNPIRALLQSQTQEKKDAEQPTEDADMEFEGIPLSDPADLPKITDIIPNPVDRSDSKGRPVPELDFKRYVKLGNSPYTPRSFPEFTYQFEATNVYSNPLYFEDPMLERYGHAHHPVIQPFASVGLFSLQLAGLPYQMAINHPTEKIYPLGWYSPGDYVPYRMRQIPFSLKGVATQAAVVVGTGYATP